MYTVNHSRVQDRWMDRDCVEAFFRKKWEYDVLLQDGADADLLSVLLAVAVDTCSRKSTTIHRFGRREYTTAELRTQFSKLTMSHIQYVLYSLGQTTTRIHNIRAYLLTSLYNAPDTMTFYYSRKVYEDLGYQPVSNFGNNDKSDPFRISDIDFCQECRKETVCVEVKRIEMSIFVVPTEGITRLKEYIGRCCLILTANRSEEQKMLQIMQDAGNSVSIVTRYSRGNCLRK